MMTSNWEGEGEEGVVNGHQSQSDRNNELCCSAVQLGDWFPTPCQGLHEKLEDRNSKAANARRNNSVTH